MSNKLSFENLVMYFEEKLNRKLKAEEMTIVRMMTGERSSVR